MPKFTLQLAYQMESFGHVVVEAETPREAIAKALVDPDYDLFKDDYEGSSQTYVNTIVEGEHETVYAVGGAELVDHDDAIPYADSREAAARVWQNLPPCSPHILNLLAGCADLLDEALTNHIYDDGNGDEVPDDCPYTKMVDDIRALISRPANDPLADEVRTVLAYEAKAFDDGEDPVDGGDLVEAFAEMRERLKAALAPRYAPPPVEIAVYVSGGAVQAVTTSRVTPGVVMTIDGDVDKMDREHMDMFLGFGGEWEKACIGRHDLNRPGLKTHPLPEMADASEARFDEEFA